MKTVTNIEKIADWFLHKEPMMHKKVQKLCYYAQAWFVTFLEEDDNYDALFEDEFQAWIHGPVNKTLYDKYKKYGWNKIHIAVKKPTFTDEIEEFLEIIWDIYGEYSGHSLEAMTSDEDPWKLTRHGLERFEACYKPIPIRFMKRYYLDIWTKNQND